MKGQAVKDYTRVEPEATLRVPPSCPSLLPCCSQEEAARGVLAQSRGSDTGASSHGGLQEDSTSNPLAERHQPSVLKVSARTPTLSLFPVFLRSPVSVRVGAI